MSYSMSPPPFSPDQGAGSPPNPAIYGLPPPAKRPRLSPDPRSPTNSAMNHAAPQHVSHRAGGYGNPYAPHAVQSPYGASTIAGSPQNSFNTPQPYPYQHHVHWQPTPTATPGPAIMRHASPPSQQAREMMPPPPKPDKAEREEKVGVEEIGDSLFGSGINLKEEENYIHNMYNNRHAANESFSTFQNTSFGSSAISPYNSFNHLTQDTSIGSQDANGAFAGAMAQPHSQEDIELEQRRKREAAAKSRAERRQHHLNNQFLLCNNVRTRLNSVARAQGVMLNVNGVYERRPETHVMVNGFRAEGIVAAEEKAIKVKQEESAPSVVAQGAPFENIVSLISLACGERLRGLLDESYSLSRARRYGDHGIVVPPEFADIADGEGKSEAEKVVPENVTGTQWDKVAGPASSPGNIEMTDVEIGMSTKSQPQHTLSFQGRMNAHLRKIAEHDQQAEKRRLKKRETRKRAAETAASGEAALADVSTEPSTTNNPADVVAPVKMTKKEQMKQQKEKNTSTEAQLHSTTNQTAAMMALGKKGARYAWMSGGASSMPTNRFVKTSSTTASGSTTPSAIKQEAGSPVTGGVAVKPGSSGAGADSRVPEWGDWRENGIGGRNIQLRDWILILERDGKEKGALHKALLKLK